MCCGLRSAGWFNPIASHALTYYNGVHLWSFASTLLSTPLKELCMSCNRCQGTDSSPLNFLLTCCKCKRRWHHRESFDCVRTCLICLPSRFGKHVMFRLCQTMTSSKESMQVLQNDTKAALSLGPVNDAPKHLRALVLNPARSNRSYR